MSIWIFYKWINYKTLEDVQNDETLSDSDKQLLSNLLS